MGMRKSKTFKSFYVEEKELQLVVRIGKIRTDKVQIPPRKQNNPLEPD